MPIVNHKFENGQTGPVMLCDVCGQHLNDGHGMVCWTPTPLPSGQGKDYSLRFACDPDCLHVLDRTLGHQHTQDIGAWIVFLRNNARVDMKQAENMAGLVAML